MAHVARPVIALIPARGGSKGVPRKNLAVLGGQPLVAHTVAAARQARAVDRVVVSSDDDEILALARSLGAEALPRPEAMASDTASAEAVVTHFMSTLSEADRHADPLLIYLQPTSPLRTSAHIDAAFDLLERQGGSTLVSVVELNKSPYKSFALDAQGRMKSLFDERMSNARRQDLPPAYLPNGAIYIFGCSDFVARAGFPSNGSLPYVMSGQDSIDIDTREDLARAQRILGERHG
jgi:CMP-N,N'-diacetyllegionaminic acid synthase